MEINKLIPKSSFSVMDYADSITYILEGIIVVVLAVYFFIPNYQKIQDLRFQVEQNELKLANDTSYADYLKDLAISGLAYEEDIINYVLPSENDIITLIVTYEGLAKQQEGVKVSPINLAPGVLDQEKELETGDTGLQRIDFSMSVNAASEDEARSFIENVINARRIFDIQSMSWEAPTKDTTEKSISLDLAIATYYYIHPDSQSLRSLVEQGKVQQTFIQDLESTKAYEDLILKDVEIGKDDLFN